MQYGRYAPWHASSLELCCSTVYITFQSRRSRCTSASPLADSYCSTFGRCPHQPGYRLEYETLFGTFSTAVALCKLGSSAGSPFGRRFRTAMRIRRSLQTSRPRAAPTIHPTTRLQYGARTLESLMISFVYSTCSLHPLTQEHHLAQVKPSPTEHTVQQLLF